MARKKAKLHKKAFTDDVDAKLVAEIISRSHQGIPVDISMPLEKKSNNPDILHNLLELEQIIIKKARDNGVI